MKRGTDTGHVLPEGRLLTPHNEDYRSNPKRYYDMLRVQAPRHNDAEYGRTLLTTFPDVKTSIRDKRFSVDAKYSKEDSYMRRIAANGLDTHEGEAAYTPPLVLLDDPDHRRVRSLMSKAFNPQSIAGLRGRIQRIASSLLDEIGDRKEIDLIEAFAGPLPTQVILDMMGMTNASTSNFKVWSEDILMGYDPERGDDVQKKLKSAYVNMSLEFREAVKARRVNPKHDLISAMVRAQEDDDQLSDLEIISLCTQLMVAGNVTTSDLISNGVFALMNCSQSLKKLTANPSLILSAVEEMLRFDCPIAETARIAKEDLQLNGCPVKAGDTITASLSAANHDPRKFPDPHVFDIERINNDHLGFGSGIHVCLGAPLARLEVQIAVQTLLARYPHIKFDPKIAVTRRELPFFSGFTRLNVSLW